MKTILLAAGFSLLVTASWATEATCKAQAEKLPHPGLIHRFMQECATHAIATCSATAQEKKLFGAARTSFVKKCEADAVGV